MFEFFGVLDSIVSDNSTQFAAKEYKNFCKMHQMKPDTSLPYHPRLNGFMKRFVDSFKRVLRKTRNESGE